MTSISNIRWVSYAEPVIRDRRMSAIDAQVLMDEFHACRLQVVHLGNVVGVVTKKTLKHALSQSSECSVEDFMTPVKALWYGKH